MDLLALYCHRISLKGIGKIMTTFNQDSQSLGLDMNHVPQGYKVQYFTEVSHMTEMIM
jgi:hypothetical protein